MASSQPQVDDERPGLSRGKQINLSDFQHPEHEEINHESQLSDSPESGIVLESGETDFTEKTDKTLTNLNDSVPDREQPEPNELFNFDLANPQAITQMLECVDLTDEDTDVLLQEAYSINRKLKEILRRRDRGEILDPSEEALLQEQTVVVVPSSAVGPRAVTAGDQGRDPAFSKNDPLPPIKSTDNQYDPRAMSALYSAKLNRRPVPPQSAAKRVGVSGMTPSANVHGRQAGGNGVHSRVSSATQKRTTQTSKGKRREVAPVPIGERPPWNDRL